MGSLSPLVSHGQLVWQLLLVLAAIAGISLAWALPRRALVRRAARLRESLGKPETSLDSSARGKPVVLVGTVVRPDDLPAEASPLAAATLVPEGMERAEELSQKARTATVGGGPLLLDVHGGRVVVEGNPQILVGGMESAKVVEPRRVRLTLWELASELSDLKNAPFALRTVSYGDRVLVSGKLRHEPDASTPQTYRSGSGAYFLAPEDDDAKHTFVPVVYAGNPRPLAQSRALVAAQVLAAPVCALVLLGAVGEATIRAAQASETSAAIATLTPFRRAEGLAALRAHVDLGAGASDATLERAARIDVVRGYCGTASDTYANANRPERAAQIAKGCGDEYRAARALFVAGDLERAALSFAEARKHDPKLPPSLSEITAYVATDKADDAATVGHALLAAWEGPRASRDELTCVVDALDLRAGGTHDTGALERHAQEDGTRVPCNLLLLDSPDEAVRKRADDRVRYTGEPRVLAFTAMLAEPGVESIRKPYYYGYEYDMGREVAGIVARLFPVAGLFTQPKELAFAVPPALSRDAFRALAAAPSSKNVDRLARAGLSQATTRAFLGDFEGALAILDELDRALAPFAKRSYTDAQKSEWDRRNWAVSDDDPERYQARLAAEEKRIRAFYDPERDLAERIGENVSVIVKGVRAEVLLRAGKPKEALALFPALPDHSRRPPRSTFELFEVFAEVRASHSARALDRLASGDGRESNRKLWLAAQSGDGKNLVARLREQRGDGRGIVDVAGASLPEGRAELQHWVRYEYPAPCSICGLFPLLNYVGSRLDAARAVGDEATAAELVATRKRLDPLLARRDVAILVHMLGELSPP